MRTVGIDLGTTNSVAAIEGTSIRHASGMESSAVLPSVVAFPPSGAVLVGAAARKRRAIDPKNTVYSAKRLMGQGFMSYAASQFRRQYPFELAETPGGGCAFRTRAGDQTPVTIGARVVAKLMSERQASTAHAVAVVTVPTSFDERAREATCQAVLLAGFADVRVLEEPLATAIAYSTIGGEKPRRALVYDFGGGTFDLSVLDCTQGKVVVLAHAGDMNLGGDDIDRAIGEWVSAQVMARVGWDTQSDPEIRDRLLGQCERAKIRLGFTQAARIELSEVDPAAPAGGESVVLSREQLGQIAHPFVQRTFACADEALRAAGIKASEIDVVYLAGGATSMPSVREGVAGYFGSLPRCDFDPMEVVAIGASLHQP